MSRLVSGPREGWFSFLLLLVVVLIPAISLADAAWVDDLWIVPWVAFSAVLLGTLLAKLRVRWPVAALFATEIGTFSIAAYFASLAPKSDWESRLLWLWDRVWAWLQVAFGGGMSNDSMLFALIMALTAWFLGCLSAWFVFRMHNEWPALIMCGSGLLLNLSYGSPNSIPLFLLFLLAALLLLVRVTLFQKERDWDSADADYNRGITWGFLWRSAFLSAAIIALAWTMPTGTVNASVADSWYQITGPWQGMQVEFDRLFSSVGATNSKVEGNRFSKTLALKGAIELGTEPVMVVASLRPEYWSAQTYDKYTGQGWISTAETTTRLDANDERLASTSMYKGRLDLEQRFKSLSGRTSSLFAAGSPVKVSLPAYADHFDSLDQLAALRFTIPLRQGQQYAVISSVSVASAELLRKAGTAYPDWVRRYMELPGNSTRRVVQMARRVIGGATNPYDAALAIESYLRGFKYEVKVPTPPPDRDAVDWFLFQTKEGYCDYFASSMAVMARAVGIPSRVVTGYNTGTFDQQLGVYEIRQENAHAWPELFFPEYGWVRFEPTPSQPVAERPETAPAEAAPEASSETDVGALSFDTSGRDKMLLEDGLDLSDTSSASSAGAIESAVEQWLPVLIIVVIAGMLLMWLLWRQLLSKLSTAGRAYLHLYWVAGLLGWRLRPSYTPSEYARVVGGASPKLRPEVEAVVAAYVEETYGGARPTTEEAVRLSSRRLRYQLPVQLLRSALSRWRSAISRKRR